MNAIFLIGSIQSFFFTALLLRRSMSSSHRILSVFFVLNGLILLDHYLESTETLSSYPHLLGLTYTLPILLGPVIYHYTLSLTTKNIRALKYWLIHGLVFVVLTTYFIFDYYLLTATEKLVYFNHETTIHTSVWIYITELFLNLSVPIYAVCSLFQLTQHSKSIANEFSYLERINLRWLRVIIYMLLLLSVVALFMFLLSDVSDFLSYAQGDGIMYTGLSIGIFFIGFYGIKQQAIYTSDQATKVRIDKPVNNSLRYQKSGLKSSDLPLKIEELKAHMKIHKPYLDGKLSLRSLAKQIDLTENNLSQLINEGLQKSFYDFVNGYRVEEFKHKLSDQEYSHLTLLDVAFECGFNSKSEFNEVFKKHTSMTPTQYKNNTNTSRPT